MTTINLSILDFKQTQTTEILINEMPINLSILDFKLFFVQYSPNYTKHYKSIHIGF